jgi:small-conductance mechanosensitive channel
MMNITRAIAIIGVCLCLFGYAILGYYLTHIIIKVAAVLAAAFISATILHTLVDSAVNYLSIKRRRTSNDAERGIIGHVISFILIIVGDLLIAILAIRSIVPVFGIPERDITTAFFNSLDGVNFGGMTISPLTIFIAIGILAIGLLVTRLIQRLLDDRLLSRSRIDIGVRNSIRAGIGYTGIAATILIAVSTFGLDLSRIALIAGALSVGIGFGLQNVVNNFVSGLILLIERPIKQGDWISIGTHEGIVKQVNVRATEIETFQRSSLIVPNSEMTSASLINWTHKNAIGRVEVVVGVAYESDPDEVVETINSCFADHTKVRAYPAPVVICMEFADSSIVYRGQGFVNNINEKILVESEIRMALIKRFRDESITIPYPQRDLHILDLPEGGTLADNQVRDNPPQARQTTSQPIDQNHIQPA